MNPDRAERLRAILAIEDCQAFLLGLYRHVIEKMSTLSEIEEEAFLILSMLPEIEINGFDSLFYQLYTLRQCAVVENTLRKSGLEKLAILFSEAKSIYLRGNTNLTEKEFRKLDVFTLDAEQRLKFGEIADRLVGEMTASSDADAHFCQYFKTNLGRDLRRGQNP